jgi:proline iminopeptidase
MESSMPELLDIRLANLTDLGDGRTVEWEASGSGEDLVWFEGGPGFWAHLARPDVALVAARFRCHLVNATGCGRSSPPPVGSGYGVASDIEFYEAAFDALDLHDFTLMGHSWGGSVAVAYAAAHPERVRRLIVIDGWCGWPLVDRAEAAAEEERAFDRLRDRAWFADAMAHREGFEGTEAESADAFGRLFPVYFAEPDRPPATEHIARIRRQYRYDMDAANHYDSEAVDVTPYLALVRCPTLVVCGDLDWIAGPSWNRPIAEGIVGAEFHVFEGTGHLPHYEAPDAFRSVLFDWLDRNP